MSDFSPRFTPSPHGLTAEFYRHLAGGELRLQRCDACERWRHPPRLLCGACGSASWGWQRVSGRGRIYSWERVWHPVHPALKEACPYLIVLVELPDADHVRMVGNLLGDPRQEMRIGTEVEAVFEDREHATLVQWRTI